MITDFLKTKRSKRQLRIALKVIEEFKGCENEHEWLALPFSAWAKLEQLEEYLSHITKGTPLQADTIAYRKQAEEEPCPRTETS